jgi:hypothetical protein
MKYLKSYNDIILESESTKSYDKVQWTQFNDMRCELFSDSEISYIKKFLEERNFYLIFEVKSPGTRDPNGNPLFNYITVNIESDGSKNKYYKLQIYKYIDEWFQVVMDTFYKRSYTKRDPERDNYKCDQLDSIVELINDVIK